MFILYSDSKQIIMYKISQPYELKLTCLLLFGILRVCFAYLNRTSTTPDIYLRIVGNIVSFHKARAKGKYIKMIRNFKVSQESRRKGENKYFSLIKRSLISTNVTLKLISFPRNVFATTISIVHRICINFFAFFHASTRAIFSYSCGHRPTGSCRGM